MGLGYDSSETSSAASESSEEEEEEDGFLSDTEEVGDVAEAAVATELASDDDAMWQQVLHEAHLARMRGNKAEGKQRSEYDIALDLLKAASMGEANTEADEPCSAAPLANNQDGRSRSGPSAPPLTADPASAGGAMDPKVQANAEADETFSASDVASMSTESEGESDASDYLHVAVSSTKDFTTPEDRALEAARELAHHLRERPLLPPHPLDSTQPWTDVDSGVALPLWHCAFSRCGEVFADEEPLIDLDMLGVVLQFFVSPYFDP